MLSVLVIPMDLELNISDDCERFKGVRGVAKGEVGVFPRRLAPRFLDPRNPGLRVVLKLCRLEFGR